MTMQIKSIVLYSIDGDKRILNFRLGEVNIVTGKSKTGKSSIINIIDYCLGRADFQVAAGVIQENVAWYAVIYYLNGNELIIAKPHPFGGGGSQEAYYQLSSQIDIPELSDLYINSHDDAIVSMLSLQLGISPNEHIVPDDSTSPPLSANIKHSKPFLFQPQSVIANRDVLFHRQSEPFYQLDIKRTLPYFLGIIQEDRLELQKTLEQKRRDLRKARAQLEEIAGYKIERVNRGKSLVVEAQQVGLISPEVSVDTIQEAIELLSPLRSWQPSIIPSQTEDRLNIEEQVLRNLREDFRSTEDEIVAANLYVQYSKGYLHEATEQVSRLLSINLFDAETTDDNICPLCGSDHVNPPRAVTSINRSLQSLSDEVSTVVYQQPNIDEHIRNLEERLQAIRQDIEQKQLDIATLLEEHRVAEEYRDTNTRIARVVGRISFFLDITPITTDEEAEFRKEVTKLQNEIQQLEEKLDISLIEDRQASILNLIGRDMTDLASYLEMEFPGPYRFDIKRLTVVVDRPDVPIIMNKNMGSAANHLGSHLITLLALHKFFISSNRPVPSFLILDQPTQVYFPPERDEDMQGNELALNNEDRQAVHKIFKLLFHVTEEMGLQIIVLDHANLQTDEFQKAIVDVPWRNGAALIPEEWLI